MMLTAPSSLTEPFGAFGNHRAARAYASMGIPVFPANARKRPVVVGGHHAATADRRQVDAWWTSLPGALVAVPTGPASGVWVVDIDGQAGQHTLKFLLTKLGIASVHDLTAAISRTPSGGCHLVFQWRSGELPRTRAGEIGPGVDTRGVKADGTSAGYFIAPGSVLPDGRAYEWIDRNGSASVLRDATPAPRGLLFEATFSARQRWRIAQSIELAAAIRCADPLEWPEIFDRNVAPRHIRFQCADSVGLGMKRQALDDLAAEADRYAQLIDGRRIGLFTSACRIAKYAANNVLGRDAITDALCEAATANEALQKYGRRWAENTVSRGLDLGQNDALPLLHRRYRTRSTSAAGWQS